MRLLILAVALLPASAPPPGADRFDLICKFDGGKQEVRYRVDLARNEACADSCDRVWKMGQPTSGQLKLIERIPALRGDVEERATVNRVSGEYEYYTRSPGYTSRDHGICSPTDFSGFPTAKF